MLELGSVDLGRIRHEGVVRNLALVPNVAVSGATEGLNGKHVALLHLGLVVRLDDGDALVAVDAVVVDRVPVQVPDGLDGVSLAVQLDLVALHRLLDGPADLAQPGVDARLLDTRVGGRLDRRQQVVVLGLEGHGEGAVQDAPVDVHADVDLDDVVLPKHHLVARVGRVVRRHVVQVHARGEAHARDDGVALLQAGVAHQRAHAVLDPVGDVRQRHARLDPPLRPLPHLPVRLGRVPVVPQEVVVHQQPLPLPHLLAGRAVPVLVAVVLDLLAGRVGAVGEELRQEDPRGVGLGGGLLLLLLLLVLLLLLLGGSLPVPLRAGRALVRLVVGAFTVLVGGGSALALGLGSVLHCNFTPTTRRDDLDNKTHYEILQVHTNAPPSDIKKSFYALSKAHHPDHNQHDPAAGKRFMRISEAYSVLSSAERRARYDRDVLRLHEQGSTAHTHTHGHGHHQHQHRGSYSSTGPAGGRPASGLSRRRGTFHGPPPSFYRNGGWGAHQAKRGQAHEESTTGGHSSNNNNQSQQQWNNTSYSGSGFRNFGGGMGPGQDPFGKGGEAAAAAGVGGGGEVPHFDRAARAAHTRTQARVDEIRQRRRGMAREYHFPGGGGGGPGGGDWGESRSFFAVLSVLGIAIGVPYFVTRGWDVAAVAAAPAKRQKRKETRKDWNGTATG
ncbi:hypothetical protein VMCG_06534 [Cytospora schulzeri]|uniref:J domain-containing protein n=1 Tax=Cytospora schulzeri TaxID=448051 RepID=A0A423WBU5_9PEZI|nr:hypothetical protein VMCG_06534 [Valsa malicola]